MINTTSKQPDNNKIDLSKNFSTVLKELMEIKNITQSELVKLTHISKGTISCMLNDTNHKGKNYLPTPIMIMTISVGIKLTPTEKNRLFYAAYPELSFLDDFLEKGLDVMEANEILDENGLSLLGNIKEE